MTVSEKMVAGWWGFLGLVITAISVPVAIAASPTWSWVGVAVGLVLVVLAVVSVVSGRAIFGDGHPGSGFGRSRPRDRGEG